MKVLHVISSMDPKTGGVCEAVRIIAGGLQESGIDNEVVCLDEVIFNSNGHYIQHALGPAKNAWYYSKKLLPWLIENIARFDVVIVHGLWLYHSYAVTKAFGRLKKTVPAVKLPRLLTMPHGMLDPYFQRAKGRKIKALRNVIYWGLIEKNTINKADEILFTCETELHLAREPFWPYKPKMETVVGLGVEAPPAYNTAMTLAYNSKFPNIKDSPYLLFLGRINEKKGVDLLINSYQKMVEHQIALTGEGKPNTIPKLIIAGPGLNTIYGTQLQQLVLASALLNKLVHFPGMLTGAAKWGAFYGCEAFILPSHQENFGIAVVEALTCNKPVLISNQVNIWREIEETGGALVADNTHEGTYKLLHEWSKLSATDKKKMGYNARRCYEKHFAVSTVISRFQEVFKTSLSY
ncbi:glycosyltransferase [Mucilaginibacter sp.]|uniref:glycosyltransferase n=1 Tax=Mucilaginibacter sp. TaxID=1882438 RepID=UPI0025E32892|nr:glycosyltransferase [Mucilaginibacter sp.]